MEAMPEAERSKRDWSHEGGMPLSEVDVDASYSGTVTNVGQYGVFVDFGAVKDALLKIPSKVGRRLKKGMELQGLAVLSLDADAGKVVMEADEAQLPELPPRQKRAQSAGPRLQGPREGGASKRTRSRQPRNWDHADATPLADIQVGDVLQGTVTNVSVYGVFVDVGAVRDARLNIPAAIGRRFSIGDVVEDVTIESIDLEQQRMSATLQDAEAAVADLPPKTRAPKAKAKGKAKARAESPKPKSKAKAKAKPAAATARSTSPAPARSGGLPIEKMKIGAVVDGIVTNRNQFGVFVNIGCSKDARLNVPKSMAKEFQKGDEVYGMTIDDVDLERNQISCGLENPELSVDDVPSKQQKQTGRASSRGPPASKAKSKPKAKAASRPSSAPPVRRYRVGSIADGLVTNVTPQGVFVDIGAAKDGMLKLPRAIAQQFQVGDEVQGMVVESVRNAAGVERITLSLEEPEFMEPQPKKASAKAKAKAASPPAAKAAGKARAKSASTANADGVALSRLRVGSEVEGTVTNVNQYGVFVDIGAVKDGRLNIARKEWKKFRKGDRIEGMVLEHVDVEANQIGLELPYDLGDEPEEYVPPPKPVRQRSRPPAGGDSRAGSGANKPAARPTSARSGSGTRVKPPVSRQRLQG